MPEAQSSSSPSSSLEEKIALFLAYVWRQFYAVHGKKIRKRNPLDVFQHRVKVASYQPSFPKFMEKLAHGLGLQSLAVHGDLVEELGREGEKVIQIIRDESVYLVARAYNLSRKIKGGGENENAPNIGED